MQLVESGKIKPDDANDTGSTPLLFAIEASFSVATISKLVDLGCDTNA